ncbi:MAG TPA: hypothetical protein PLH98_01315 [Ruminococcus flavefaciens]|mgnify:FL=1|nr:hypothetical protein [Ruminococcus flavefaciens]
MADEIKYEKLTNIEREYIHGDAKEKNKIDDGFYFHITPQMRSIFADHADSQPLTVFRNNENFDFRRVSAGNCPVRKITAQEYEAFPAKDKNSGNIIPRALLSNIVIVIVFLVFLFLWVASLRDAIEKGFLLYTSMMPVIGGIVLAIFMHSSVSRLRAMQLTTDSEAAFGSAVFFHHDTNMGDRNPVPIKYVDVALYDEKVLIERVYCSKKVYKMISQGSEVVVYGKRVYAYDNNGKLIGE